MLILKYKDTFQLLNHYVLTMAGIGLFVDRVSAAGVNGAFCFKSPLTSDHFLLLFVIITLYHGMEDINNHHHTPARSTF